MVDSEVMVQFLFCLSRENFSSMLTMIIMEIGNVDDDSREFGRAAYIIRRLMLIIMMTKPERQVKSIEYTHLCSSHIKCMLYI